jgi:hypothetical protein
MASWPNAAVTDPEPLIIPVTVPSAYGVRTGIVMYKNSDI